MRTIKSIGTSLFLCMFLNSQVFAAVMVSNLGEVSDYSYFANPGGPEAQGFTTDGFFYKLTSVTIDIVSVTGSSGNFTLSIFDDDSGLPGSILPNGLLSGPNNPSIGENSYTASGVINLSPSTTYWVVAQANGGDRMYELSFTSSLSQTGAWSILDYEAYSEDSGVNWDNDPNCMRMSISADPGDSAPTGIPSMNEWGMIIMSLMLAGSAIWMIRRRQIT